MSCEIVPASRPFELVKFGPMKPSSRFMLLEFVIRIYHAWMVLFRRSSQPYLDTKVHRTTLPNILARRVVTDNIGLGAGVLLKVGSDLSHLSVGDKVLLSFNSCGSCTECRDNAATYCHQYGPLNFGGRRGDGSQAMTTSEAGQPLFSNFFGQSSFSKVAIVNGRTIVKVPSSTDLSLFAPLGCGIQTGVGTIFNTLNVQPEDSVAVFGVGAVGMASVMAAKLRGANPIIAVDIDQSRLALARELGASHTIVNSGRVEDHIQEVQKICGGNGVRRAVDCSGIPSVIEQMIRSLGSRGKAATVGAPAPGKTVKVDVFSHIIKGTHYIGSCEGDSIPAEVSCYYSRRFDN